MIRINLYIKFLSTIKSIVGRKELIIKVNSNHITLDNLINELIYELGESFRELIFNLEAKEINPEILIFVDSKEISSLQKLKTPLSDGNQIVFLSSIHGGFKM